MKITRHDVGLVAVTFATGFALILAAFLVQPDTAPGLRDRLSGSAGFWFFAGVFALIELLVLWLLYGSLRALSLVIGLGLLVAASWWVGAQLFI
jgi:hypothetical protein